MSLRNIAVGLIACAALAALLAGPARARSLMDLTQKGWTDGGRLFGSIELTGRSFQTLPQWDRVIGLMSATGGASGNPDDETGRCARPGFESWCRLLAEAAPLGRMAQLEAVNRFFNRLPYSSDRATYGLRDYWATPWEFMSRSGDCEDYSIAKYFTLRELGFSQDWMRIVILKDNIDGTGHAVLAVYVHNDILILDNRSNLITSHSRYKHYIPLYSMNETANWFHTTVPR